MTSPASEQEGCKQSRPCFQLREVATNDEAFRDALTDILPSEHGFRPTLRIADFEVREWITTASAEERMRELLDGKFRNEMTKTPLVSIVMGSDSDLDIMNEAAKALAEFAIPYEIDITSAHRSPARTSEYRAP